MNNPESFELSHNPEERGFITRLGRALRLRLTILALVVTPLSSSDDLPVETSFEIRPLEGNDPEPKK